MEWFKRMKEKKNEKKELQTLIDIAEDEKFKHLRIWDEMLYVKSKITILEAKTAAELSQKWDDFHTQYDTRNGRLGSIWAFDDKKHYVDNGVHYLMIQYQQFSLRDGFDIDTYNKAIEDYERSKTKLKELEEKMKMFE
ncbi:hypothetical protein D7X33_21645 [Butyricicoccus sp. 1XD8-22]|nr:hypothetical protein D7X33_21645 [Butyricicoccus sp. 1XD8-22]